MNDLDKNALEKAREQHWAVSVAVDGDNVLTIESNCLSGVDNIDTYGDVIRNCAHHLLSFIGSAAPQDAPGCVVCGQPVTDNFAHADHLVPQDAPPDVVEMTDEMMNAGQAYLDARSLNGRFQLPGTFNWHEFWQAIQAAGYVIRKDGK